MIVLSWINLLIEPPDGKRLKGSSHVLNSKKNLLSKRRGKEFSLLKPQVLK